MEDHLEVHELLIAAPLNIEPAVQILLVELLKIGLNAINSLLDIVFVVRSIKEGAQRQEEQHA